MTSFPNDYVNPEKKDEQYWLQVSNAIWARYDRGYGAFHKGSRDYVRKMRAYSSGRQSIEPYLDVIVGPKKLENGKWLRKGLMNIDYEVISIAPKLKELMLGLLEEIDHVISVEAVDEVSIDKKLTAKYQTFVKGLMMPVLKKLEKQNGVPAPKLPIEIKSHNDLEMFEMIGGFKLGIEIALEKLALAIEKESDWKSLARKLRSDVWDCNKLCVHNVYNPVTSKVEKKYVDIENVIIGRSESLSPYEIPYAGQVKTVTIGEIYNRVCDGRPDKEERIERLINTAMGNSANSSYKDFTISQLYDTNPIDQSPKYFDLSLNVLQYEYITVDRTYKTYREKDGVKKYHTDTWGMDKSSERRATNVVDAQMLYDCTWVIGTQYMVEYGKSLFMSRPEKKRVRTNYTYIEIPGASKVERIIGYLNSMQITHMKLQAAKMAAAPKGIAIDVNSLQKINLGDGINTPLELVKVYKKTGTYAYRSFSLHNKLMNQNHGSITELEGGIGRQLEEWMTCMTSDLRMIMEITGFTDVSAASPDQSPEMTVGAAQIAMQQTNNSMKMIYESVSEAKADSVSCACSKAVRAIVHNPESEKQYARVIGNNSVKVLKSMGVDAFENIGLSLVAKPNQHQKNTILQAGQRALEVGKNGKPVLTYSDFFMIERMLEQGKVKEAQAFLAYQTQKAEEKNFEENMQMQKSMSQDRIQEEAAKNELKIREIQEKGKVEVAKVEAEKGKELEVETLKSQNRQTELETEARLQSTYNVELRKKL